MVGQQKRAGNRSHDLQSCAKHDQGGHVGKFLKTWAFERKNMTKRSEVQVGG